MYVCNCRAFLCDTVNFCVFLAKSLVNSHDVHPASTEFIPTPSAIRALIDPTYTELDTKLDHMYLHSKTLYFGISTVTLFNIAYAY